MYSFMKFHDVIAAEGIVQAEHRDRPLYRLESFQRRRSDPLGRRIGTTQLGIIRLKGDKFLHQTVVFRIGYFRIVKDVIPAIVPMKFLPEGLRPEGNVRI